MEPRRGPTPGSVIERSPTSSAPTVAIEPPASTAVDRDGLAAQITATLAGLRDLTADDPDPAMMSALDSATIVVQEWERHRERSQIHAAALQRATVLELDAARRATRILGLVSEIAQVIHHAVPGERLPESVNPTKQSASLTNPSGRVEVTMLGAFSIVIDGRPVSHWTGTRGLAVIQYLLVHRATVASRDVVIEAIWPEVGAEDGRRRLHQAVYAARQALDEAARGVIQIDFTGGGYRLQIAPDHTLSIDLETFEALTERADAAAERGDFDEAATAWTEAEALYSGDLLADSPWAEWAIADAERLRLKYLGVANRLGDQLIESGRFSQALEVFERAARRDPWNEESTRGLMRAYHMLGQDSVVRRVYASCADRLDRDLGVTPSAESKRLFAELTAR